MQPETLKVMRQAICALLAKDAIAHDPKNGQFTAGEHSQLAKTASAHAEHPQIAGSSAEKSAQAQRSAARAHGAAKQAHMAEGNSEAAAYHAGQQKAHSDKATAIFGPKIQAMRNAKAQMKSGLPPVKDGGPGSGPHPGGGSGKYDEAAALKKHAQMHGHHTGFAQQAEAAGNGKLADLHREAGQAHQRAMQMIAAGPRAGGGYGEAAANTANAASQRANTASHNAARNAKPVGPPPAKDAWSPEAREAAAKARAAKHPGGARSPASHHADALSAKAEATPTHALHREAAAQHDYARSEAAKAGNEASAQYHHLKGNYHAAAIRQPKVKGADNWSPEAREAAAKARQTKQAFADGHRHGRMAMPYANSYKAGEGKEHYAQGHAEGRKMPLRALPSGGKTLPGATAKDEAPNALREIVETLEKLVALRCGANDGGPGSGPHKGGGSAKPLPKGFGMKAGSSEHLAGKAVAAKEAAERAKAEEAAQAERTAKWRASTESMREPIHNKYD